MESQEKMQFERVWEGSNHGQGTKKADAITGNVLCCKQSTVVWFLVPHMVTKPSPGVMFGHGNEE